MRDMSVFFNSNSPEWLTPQPVLHHVRGILGPIEFDPCAHSDVPHNVGAARHFTKADDALCACQDWSAQTCFMNPPYGRVIGDWTMKLRQEVSGSRIDQAIALVPGRLGARWFELLVQPGPDVLVIWCALSRRITFDLPPPPLPDPTFTPEELRVFDAWVLKNWTVNPAPFPSVLVYLSTDHTYQQFIHYIQDHKIGQIHKTLESHL